MWIDPIVKEVRKYRKEHAVKFNFDLDMIYEDFKKSEELRLQQNSLKEKPVKYSSIRKNQQE